MARIGILGGTFDPIHNGHLRLGKRAYEEFELESIWFMPSGVPPHKKDHRITEGKMRRDMVKLAIADTPCFLYSDFELKRKGDTYTAQTLTLLHRERPEDEFYFIIGADSLFSIETWKHPERLFKACIILAACRDEAATKESLNGQIQMLKGKYGAHIKFLAMPLEHVSSHEIRKLIESGEPVSEYIPAEVEAYIRKEGLYGSGNRKNQ